MRVAIFAVLFALPSFAFAANTGFFGSVVPACLYGEGALKMCQACDLVSLAENILRIFVSLSVMAAALMFAYAGVLYVTASANPGNVDSAKNVFVGTLLGLALVLSAYLIVDIVMRVFTGQNLNVLTKVDCVRVEHPKNAGFQYTREARQNVVEATQGDTPTVAAQCPAGSGYSHDAALAALNATGRITVTSTAGAAGVRDGCSGKGCTSLAGICRGTVDGLIGVASDNPCGPLTVWGAAEGGDAHKVGSPHGKGCAFDISPQDTRQFACLGNWLKQNSSRYGISQVCTTPEYAQYRVNCTYVESTDHFHLTFCK